MDKLLKSKFFTDLQNGQLPEVQVSISDRGLVSLFAGLLLVGIALILAAKIARTV